MYVDDTEVIDVVRVQTFINGRYDFVSVDLYRPGYKYEIIGRPGTLGGTAPRVDIYGQFIFAHHALPENISRAGVYVVRAADGSGRGVVVYRITIM